MDKFQTFAHSYNKDVTEKYVEYVNMTFHNARYDNALDFDCLTTANKARGTWENKLIAFSYFNTLMKDNIKALDWIIRREKCSSENIKKLLKSLRCSTSNFLTPIQQFISDVPKSNYTFVSKFNKTQIRKRTSMYYNHLDKKDKLHICPKGIQGRRCKVSLTSFAVLKELRISLSELEKTVRWLRQHLPTTCGTFTDDMR